MRMVTEENGHRHRRDSYTFSLWLVRQMSLCCVECCALWPGVKWIIHDLLAEKYIHTSISKRNFRSNYPSTHSPHTSRISLIGWVDAAGAHEWTREKCLSINSFIWKIRHQGYHLCGSGDGVFFLFSSSILFHTLEYICAVEVKVMPNFRGNYSRDSCARNVFDLHFERSSFQFRYFFSYFLRAVRFKWN